MFHHIDYLHAYEIYIRLFMVVSWITLEYTMSKMIKEIQKRILFGLVKNELYIYIQTQMGVFDWNRFNGITKSLADPVDGKL